MGLTSGRERMHQEGHLARALTWVLREHIPQWMTNVANHAYDRCRDDVIAIARRFRVKRDLQLTREKRRVGHVRGGCGWAKMPLPQ
jgi:hypothetical protein